MIVTGLRFGESPLDMNPSTVRKRPPASRFARVRTHPKTMKKLTRNQSSAVSSPNANRKSKIYNPKSKILNLAAYWPGTGALGPGLRFAVWVQGCPFHCPGCLAPEWIPQVDAHHVSVDILAEMILSDPKITGLTLSGGEPMLQAEALAELVAWVKQDRMDVDVICFTGYRYEDLLANPPNEGVRDLLANVDLLIDGPFIARQNNDRGLRGSANQRFIHLTDRLSRIDFAAQPRKVEVHLQDGQAFLVGVPPQVFGLAWENALQRTKEELDLNNEDENSEELLSSSQGSDSGVVL